MMDGQDESCGVKKREKAFELGFDSDDNEPIGVLLKLTKPRKNKKAKLGLEGHGGEGKKPETVTEEKVVDVKDNDDLGCMEDTLASFRKKLKGPKKGGVGFSRIRSVTDIDRCNEPLASKALLEQSVSERLADGAVDSKLLKKVVKKGGDDIDRCNDEIVANKSNLKQKRRRVSQLKTHTEAVTDPHDDSEHIKPARDPKDRDFASIDGVHGNGDDCLEDSLSSFFKKAQAGVTVSKPLKSPGLKLKGGKQAPLSGLKFSSADAAGGLQSVATENQNEENPCVHSSSAPNECDEAVNRASGDATCCAKDIVDVEYTVDPRGDIEVTGTPANEIRSDQDQNAIVEPGMVEDGLIRHLSGNTNCLVHDIAELPRSLSIQRLKEDKLTSEKAESRKYFTDISCERKVDVTILTIGEEVDDPVGNTEGSNDVGLILKSEGNESSKVGYYLSQGSSKLADDQRLPSDTTGKPQFPGHEYPPVDDTASGASPLSTHPDDHGNGSEDTLSLPDSSKKNRKPSAAQRPRKTKKHRHEDMAYEGDAEWETLISGHSFLESHHLIDSDRPQRSRGKVDVSAIGGTAAVSVGLKARAAGPVEKIKFKEILRRKGGLQEYLECRNWILSLWSNDMNHILSISDCGVADIASEDEPSRASLIREIYVFLDHNGYINTGIASTKPKADPNANQSTHALSRPPAVPVAGSEKTSTVIEVNNRPIINYDENELEDTESKAFSIARKLEQPKGSDSTNFLAVSKVGHDLTDLILLDRQADTDISMNEDLANQLGDCRQEPTLELKDESGLTSRNPCFLEENSDKKRAIDSGKKVIVIGAGPAGLTATRHLQRQGFSVTVLEARSRIGGRVYTDHSSLSVPVDLGASIITGVEADMTSERRPDPSALVCAQLGLEMTLLNSDCPLYDVVTGEKVAADLDEALEAEYNSLLDDMVLVVAQNGEQAMKMSLEDGLEYALRRRRMSRGGNDIGEKLHSFAESKSKVETGVTGDDTSLRKDVLSPLERRVMNWHFAHLEYGCAALLKEVSLPYWNQDDAFGGFGGAHCMIKGGFSSVVESLGKGIDIHLNHVVTDVSYRTRDSEVADDQDYRVKVSTSNGRDFLGDAVLITVPLGCLKAESIKFLPPLPQWKQSSIKRLGFGVLNKIVLEFPEAFWDDSVDYFGATAEQTDNRGQCFMFWNVKKTVGAPILIALLVGKAAIDGQDKSSHEHVNHAVIVLRKLFGEESVPDPVGSVVTDWGRDPFSYGAYTYVAIGASGEDYDIIGKPVENCLFFAGEATCKEHPDTVGGAMMSGLREAVRIIDLLSTGKDLQAEIEALEVAQRQSDSERDEVRDITKRLDAVELSNYLYKNSLEGDRILSKEALLQDLFFTAKTTAGRLSVAKALLNLPVETLKSFAGTKEGLSMLNSWILDSLGKDGTQLLRHCVRLLVLISTDLLAVRTSGIGKTVKEKVCVHTSRDIRAIASQLVSVWLEVFRKEKASNGRLKLLRQPNSIDSSKKSGKEPYSGKVPSRMLHGASDSKGNPHNSASGSHAHSGTNPKKTKSRPPKMINDSKSESNSSRSRGSVGRLDSRMEDAEKIAMSEEEKAAFEAAEAARAAAIAAAEAYASSEAKSSMMSQLPKIPSFHKFARRDQYSQMEEFDLRRKWSGGVLGKQDCLSEIDSRNCRVRDWSVDFSAACVNLDNTSKKSVDNLSQRSHSNEVASLSNFRENSGESAAVDSSIFTKAWVDAAGSEGGKDHHAIERWQSQAAAAESDFFHQQMHVIDEEDSNTHSRPSTWKHDRLANESSVSQVTENKEGKDSQHKGADRIKQSVVDYVASLLMPLYKARKIDRDGYKSIMKKTATKVMEQATDLEKAMAVSQFLDYKRRNKIRAFVDTLIERHMATKSKP